MSKPAAPRRKRKACAYDDCERPATTLAVGRPHYRAEKSHPLAKYCDVHAVAVADEGNPEYTEACPNCGCRFGVN